MKNTTKTCYAELTTRCNLSCPYCDIKNMDDHWNRDKFMKQLHEFDGKIILFGGEPTLYKDRLIDVFLSDPIINRKIKSITTNFMHIDDTILTILQMIKGVATSYSPTRFTDEEYKIWLSNINEFGEKVKGKTIGVLATMTFEMLNMSPDEMINIMKEWNNNVIEYIQFEHYVGPETTEEYFIKCDEWLCKLYSIWDTPIKLKNILRIRYWNNDCSNIYTIHPNGELTKGCPHNNKFYIPDKCYTCDKQEICRPCRLQKYCSYMPKFAELTKNILYN